MIITLAGHVDHGKTAVVHALTGINTDRLKEEQARGLTIDLGFAYATFDEERIGFVDVPGHRRFIHNMIAGVASQQHALVIIAADDGIMPQTIEHAQILELLGIRSGTIVINKIDIVEATRLRQVRESIGTWQSANFLRDASAFEVAATTMTGIEELRTHLVATSKNFTQAESQRPFRMAIDRSFRLRGAGTVVTGTIASGQVHAGDELYLTSTSQRVRARGINVQGRERSEGRAGDRCSLNIAGTDVSRAKRGDWVFDPAYALTTQRVSVFLTTLADFPRPVKHWSSIHVYHLTDHCEARLSLLESQALTPGSSEFAEIHCDSEMHFKAGDRLIFRDRDLARTLGGGTVLALVPESNARRRTKTNLQFLRLLYEAIQAGHMERAIETHAAQGLISIDELARFFLYEAIQLKEFLQQPTHTQLNGLAMATTAVEANANQLKQLLRDFHQVNPAMQGMSFGRLSSHVALTEAVLQFTLDCLLDRGELRHVNGQYLLPEHKTQAANYDDVLYLKIEPLLDAPQPLSLGDVAKHLRMSFQAIEKAMRPMIAAGVIVRVNKNRYFTPSRLQSLQQTAYELSAKQPFTVKQFRDESLLGRNTVIDVLEYFDRQRITHRRGDVRVVLES